MSPGSDSSRRWNEHRSDKVLHSRKSKRPPAMLEAFLCTTKAFTYEAQRRAPLIGERAWAEENEQPPHYMMTAGAAAACAAKPPSFSAG